MAVEAECEDVGVNRMRKRGAGMIGAAKVQVARTLGTASEVTDRYAAAIVLVAVAFTLGMIAATVLLVRLAP